jgi:hypothetical protein
LGVTKLRGAPAQSKKLAIFVILVLQLWAAGARRFWTETSREGAKIAKEEPRNSPSLDGSSKAA